VSESTKEKVAENFSKEDWKLVFCANLYPDVNARTEILNMLQSRGYVNSLSQAAAILKADQIAFISRK